MYLGRSPLTAVQEYYASEEHTPLVLIPVRYRLKRVIDITGDLAGWSEDWQQWECDWRAALSSADEVPDCASWRCGDDAIQRKASSILYPSKYDPSGTALAIFTEDAVLGTCTIEVQDPFETISDANPLGV